MDSPSKFNVFELKGKQQDKMQLGTLDNGIGPRGPALTRTVVSIVSTSTHTLSDFT